MKKSLVLAASLFSMICTAQNIVNNSSFEEQMSGWNQNIDSNSGANAKFSIAKPGCKDSSAFNANVKTLGKNPWDIMLMQDLSTLEGKYYELTLNAKAAVSGKKIRLQFQNTTYTSKDIELTTEWASYNFGLVAKENDLQFVIQFFEEGNFDVDNIVVQQKEKPAKALMQNGSFENDLEGWNQYVEASSSAKATFNVVNGGSSGAKSLEVGVDQLGKKPWDIALIQQLGTLEGEFYELKLHAKAATAGKKIRLQFQNTTYTSQDITLTADWAEYTFSTVAKEDDLQIAVQFFEKGNFSIDDFKIIKKDLSNMPLIQNGSFEKEGENWINIKDNGGNAIFSYSEENPVDGKKSQVCLVLVKGRNPWDIQSIANFPTERYKKYRLTFYAKSNTAGTKLKAQIQKTTYTPKDFTLTTDWQKYEFTFSAKENDMQMAFHYLDTGLYYIDNVKMEKLSKSKKKKKKR